VRLALASTVLLLLAASPQQPLLLETLDGETVELLPSEGRPALVVHFWATWCPSCVEELPELTRAAARCGDDGVELVVVNVGEDAETVREYLAERRVPLRSLRDPRGRVWRKVAGAGLPANLTWTREGRRVDLGPRDAAHWARALEELGCAPADGSGPTP
jgi:thiol-disulfide isomerase/thioredoxin